MARKICVTITARPSYSRIKTALQALLAHPDIELQVVLAGSALLSRYGDMSLILQNDGIPVTEKVLMLLEGENPTTMAKTTGLGVIELSSVFYRLKPDAVVVIADRYETLAVSIAAAYQNIPLIHVQGGEITGNIDEKVRHANTKLADIHLVSTENARKRVISLGENPSFVFNTGCPSIDIAAAITDSPYLNFNPYEKYGGVGSMPALDKGYVVVLQHPVTTEYADARKQVEVTLEAVEVLKKPVLWFWPNADAGADGTSQGIRAFRENRQPALFHFFKNMMPTDFLKLLRHANCLVGNSSVGIRECAFLGIKVVNIGNRQQDRERASNVIDVAAEKKAIVDGIQQWDGLPPPPSSTLYGNGQAGIKMADILATIPLSFDKRFIC
jgi:UDP-hydrolysing UDP-N-acetyl-D-glucosamine 2-epimerase